jgi:DNA-binding NtrC family response regulator
VVEDATPYVAPQAATESATPAAATASPRGGTTRNAHVMLVEDDTMVADTVRACLERSGLQVTTHIDGASAVAAFAADPGAVDLLLTDQFMRGLDGGEVVAEIRRYRPRLPVVLMSGHPEGIRADEVARLGITGTLAKPFTPQRLLDTVKQALREDLRAGEQQG